MESTEIRWRESEKDGGVVSHHEACGRIQQDNMREEIRVAVS